uniref:Uncharacterized protein n=1 Tax=Lepeophtheirus salmonis TaxID=72036 RepID=A0A0K2UA03_LEPSM
MTTLPHRREEGNLGSRTPYFRQVTKNGSSSRE